MKIHIVGCSGSGKSYLAKRLSRKYGIPHFDLDDIQWDNSVEGYGIRMPVEKRDALLKKMLSQHDWIIEGVYYAWVQQSFEEADRIYVLDIPRYLCKARIIKRFIMRKLGLDTGKKETLKSLCDLLKWTDDFQNKNLKEIKKMLEKYGKKVEWLSKKRDIQRIIEGL